MKESPLRVIVGVDTYKAVMAKIKVYKENYMRFEGLSDSTILRGVRLFEMAGFYMLKWLS